MPNVINGLNLEYKLNERARVITRTMRACRNRNSWLVDMAAGIVKVPSVLTTWKYIPLWCD